MRENKKLGFSSVKFTRVRNTDVRGSAKLAGRLAGEAGWLRGFERRHGPRLSLAPASLFPVRQDFFSQFSLQIN